MTDTPLPESTTVLVVDDNVLNLELLKQDLGDSGYRVQAVRSGYDALKSVERQIPDIVLLDIMMPGMSGLEVLQHLRDKPETHDIPVILVTAKSQSQDIVHGLGAGANDYVTKPIDFDVLNARMQTQLRVKSLQRALAQQNDRIRRDLQEARRVQLSLMPSSETLQQVYNTYGLRILSHNRASEMLGGDFWDVINLADGSLGLLMADFAGHGVIPAFNTFRIKTFLHSSCSGISNCGLALARINALLVRELPRNDFATCIYCQYVPELRRISFANAGHPAPLLFRKATKVLKTLPSGGYPVGLFPDAEFTETDETLEPGDVLLLLTDGLLKLAGSERELYGMARLQEAIKRSAGGGVNDVHDCLLEDIRSFAGDGTPNDDLTFMLIEVRE